MISREELEKLSRWLLALSVAALLLGPVVMMLGAFSADALFIGAALLIMGGLGLYAGMRELARSGD